ncbi:MAG TPA: DUF6687 family protein, partial [Acidimicrobiales bacterium]|nr:DUF6687 family protein [Acidimicrobiales bacterium]
YVESGMGRHGDAEVVTNNHFDQDGLAGVFALAEPDVAMRHRALLEDLAAAGDFGTYRDLWIGEDERLTASEEAVEAGRVVIADEPDLDIAVVTVDPDLPATWGHRFTGQHYDGVHPMALHNATDMSGIALLHGARYRYTDRYETWVQCRSRQRRTRVALLPLARRLTEADDVRWRADAAGALAPTLSHEGESSLTPATFLTALRDHLRTAEPAWDPAVGRRAPG